MVAASINKAFLRDHGEQWWLADLQSPFHTCALLPFGYSQDRTARMDRTRPRPARVQLSDRYWSHVWLFDSNQFRTAGKLL